MLTAQQAYSIAKKDAGSKVVKDAIDFDDRHYVFAFASDDGEGMDADWVWVDKNSGKTGGFYPFSDIDAFMEADNNRSIDLRKLRGA